MLFHHRTITEPGADRRQLNCVHLVRYHRKRSEPQRRVRHRSPAILHRDYTFTFISTSTTATQLNHQFRTVSLHIRTPRFAKKPVKAPDRAAAGSGTPSRTRLCAGFPSLNKVCTVLTLSLMRACTQTELTETLPQHVTNSANHSGVTAWPQQAHFKGSDSPFMLCSGHIGLTVDLSRLRPKPSISK